VGGSPAGAGTTGTGSMPVQCGKIFCDSGVCCNAVCGICGTPDGACPEIGCAAPAQDACAALPAAPVVLGCAQELGIEVDPSAPAPVAVPLADVSAEEPRARPGGCLEPLLDLQTAGPALFAQAVSWTVTTGDRSWDVEAVVEGNKLPSLLGQKVSVSYAYEFGGFGPSHRQLSVVTKLSPSYGIWIAEGGDLPELGELPLLLSQGDAVCSTAGQCGSYSRYGIGATDPLSMRLVTVAHGQTGRLGPWVIVHGGFEEQTSTSSPCSDWFVADVHLAILGLM